MITKLFMLLIVVTMILTILQLLGYQVMESIVLMLVIDLIAFGANLEIEKRKKIEPNLSSKLEGIEKMCNEILTHIKTNPGIEEKLQKQKNEITFLLDKISKKSLELEERLNKFGKILANSIEKSKEASFPVSEIVYVEDSEAEKS